VVFTWNAANAAHLYRRAGFAATPALLAKSLNQGFDQTVASLLKPDKKMPKPGKKAQQDLWRLQTWWLARMVKSPHPLTEKMTLFWHNHFATANSKVQNLKWMHRHVAMLHDNALGDFRALVDGVSRDPAMLVWLDNWQNVVGNINENYARELMELFTTGVLDKNGAANYTEDDVIAASRAFTGWTLDSDDFFFAPWLHDEESKTFKGVTANLDGGDIINQLVDDPATAQRLGMKLWSYFAFPIELNDPIADDLAQTYLASGRSIAAMVESIFRNEAFYSDEAKRTVVKQPVEWFVSSLRLLGAKAKKGHPYEIGGAIQAMGQSLYNPPTVFGWPEGLEWVATAGLLERAATAERMADARDKWAPVKFNPVPLMGKKKDWAAMDAAAVVARTLAALDMSDVDPATVAVLEQYAAADQNGDPQPVVVDEDYIDVKVRGLLALIMSGPEYQMA
jgi:uncharacterized protein (DUF1800 family)